MRGPTAAFVGSFFILTAFSCGDRTDSPRTQLVIHIDTDAPLARSPEDPFDPVEPLFDRLRVDVVDGEAETPACEACKQDFSVDRGILAKENLSVGVIVPPGRTNLRARVRLFRGFRAKTGDPPTDAAIDRTFALPSLGEDDGVVEVTAFMNLDAVGKGPSSGSSPEPITPGRAYRHVLHEGVAPRPCETSPRAHEACVPGGAYWMSSADNMIFTPGAIAFERIVILSPFFIDKKEVTVGELRASKLSSASPTDPKRNVTAGDPTTCTFTDVTGPNEKLPVDCLTSELAQRYCESRGSVLPTEAQLEYLGTGLKSQRYLWGSDPPQCPDSVYSRFPASSVSLRLCLALGVGPQKAGSGARDVVHLEGGDVVDIGGNVAEWSSDVGQELNEPCWGPGLFVDPRCDRPAASNVEGFHVARGAAWNSAGLALRYASTRAVNEGVEEFGADVGFRCARADR